MMSDSDGDRSQAEDRLNDVFEPDVLLPIQYFAALKRKRFSCGEHRLVIAILQDAVECFQKHIHARDSKRRQLFLDAEVWVADEDYTGTFSFNNICDLLGMNPSYLRQGLFSWRDRERTRARTSMVEGVAPTLAADAQSAAADLDHRANGLADAQPTEA